MMDNLNDIKEGFNAGYIIQKHRPKVFKELTSSLNEVEIPFFDAFIKGGKEYTRDRLISIMGKDSITNVKSKQIEDNLDKDEIDIDI